MWVEDIYRVVKFLCCIEFLRMGVLWTLSLVICHLRLFVQHVRGQKFSIIPRKSVAAMPVGKRPLCIITGATSGLGAAAAKALSKEDFFVILIGRSGDLLSKTIGEILKLNANVQLQSFEVDLSTFSSIMKFKSSLMQWLSDMNFHPSIQLLINNAGILATSSRVSCDGLDEMMMTNYMGAFCLTKVLLPLLINSPVPSRVVNVSSFTHRNDPGAVKTNIMREIPQFLSLLALSVLKLLGVLQLPKEGISSILDAALAPPETSGMYFFGGEGKTIESSPISYNPILANRLWAASCDIFQELERMYVKTTSTSLST